VPHPCDFLGCGFRVHILSTRSWWSSVLLRNSGTDGTFPIIFPRKPRHQGCLLNASISCAPRSPLLRAPRPRLWRVGLLKLHATGTLAPLRSRRIAFHYLIPDNRIVAGPDGIASDSGQDRVQARREPECAGSFLPQGCLLRPNLQAFKQFNLPTRFFCIGHLPLNRPSGQLSPRTPPAIVYPD